MYAGRPAPARPGRLPLAALLAVALACGRGGGGRPGGPAPGQPRGGGRPPTPVVVAPVVRRAVPEILQAVGSVQAFVTVAVRPLVSGQIVRVFFREGEEVRTGQPLFEIDPRPYEAILAQARANLDHARRQAANARADARRYAQLVKEQYVTVQQAQAAETASAALAADVAAGEAAVRRAALDLANCRIASAVEGRTGAVLVQLGNVVQASQASPLVTIAQLRPISVAFTVPERYVEALRRGLGSMKVSAGAGAGVREGVLTFLNNSADPASGTILAKATFPNQDEALWPGQFVNVRITLGVQRDAVVAPAAAVVTGQRGTTAFVVKPDRTVEQRPVEVSRSDAQEAVIAQGLAPGEQVVVDGQLGLEPGSHVAPRPREAQAEAGGGAPRAQGRRP